MDGVVSSIPNNCNICKPYPFIYIYVCKFGTRGGPRNAATFKMDLFVIIVDGFQPLTIITTCSNLDVAAVLDPPLEQSYKAPVKKD